MDTQQLQRYELVDSFLHSIKHAQNKQDFLSKVQEFDARFIDDHSAPAPPQRQKSVQKLPPMPQEKPKNPFKTGFDDNLRHQAMMQTAQQSPFNGHQAPRGNYRTQQNFYRQNSGSGIKPEQQYPPHPMAMAGNYGEPKNGQSQLSQFNGGMGVMNYNAYSQREYDELKEQFFRPPNLARPPVDHYNRMTEENAFNFGQGMVNSLSSDLIPGQTSFSKPTPRHYPERVNPFMKQ